MAIAGFGEAIEEEILPWREKIDWGYFILYMISGVLNQHPRTAMAQMESADKNRITAYLDQITAATDLL